MHKYVCFVDHDVVCLYRTQPKRRSWPWLAIFAFFGLATISACSFIEGKNAENASRARAVETYAVQEQAAWHARELTQEGE